jgi:hypothetical protein
VLGIPHHCIGGHMVVGRGGIKLEELSKLIRRLR